MNQEVQAVLACPECRQPFHDFVINPPTFGTGVLRCISGHEYRIESGIPLLVRESDRLSVQEFADSYGPAWASAGWGCLSTAYLRNLPTRDVTHRHASEWKVKARTMRVLFDVLDVGRWNRVLDLGCGNGWLSHHLALRGHEVYAVDVLLDDRIGLGAAATYVRDGPPFLRIWGDFDHLPIQSSSLDAVICNASLHYMRHLTESLREIARVLRPDGAFFIMNSPLYTDSSSAARALADFRLKLRRLGASSEVAERFHHHQRSDLEAAVRLCLGPVSEIDFDPGRGFRWSRRLKGLILGMELASFPILLARKVVVSGSEEPK